MEITLKGKLLTVGNLSPDSPSVEILTDRGETFTATVTKPLAIQMAAYLYAQVEIIIRIDKSVGPVHE